MNYVTSSALKYLKPASHAALLRSHLWTYHDSVLVSPPFSDYVCPSVCPSHQKTHTGTSNFVSSFSIIIRCAPSNTVRIGVNIQTLRPPDWRHSCSSSSSFCRASRLSRDSTSQRWDYVGEKWPMNFAWNARLPRSIQGSFTFRKSTTWDRRLYFPSEGRRAEDFFALKKSDGVGRVWTRELGYQRPACYF